MGKLLLSVQWILISFPAAMLLGGCNNNVGPEELDDVAATNQAVHDGIELQVKESVDVAAPASCVWEVIGNFNGWAPVFPSVESSRMYGQGQGAVRFLKLTNSSDLVSERLELHQPKSRLLMYDMVSSSLPVSDYHATISVKSTGATSSRVEWSSRFEPKGIDQSQAESFIRDFYRSNLAGLAAAFLPKVAGQKSIPASPAEVWSIVGDFNALPDFLGVLQSSYLVDSGVDRFRVVTFFDGVTTSIERLDDLDEANRNMTYSALGTPFGLANYVGRIGVIPEGSGSKVIWSVAYVPLGDPAEAQALMQGAIGSGLDSLYALFASQ